MKTKLSTILLLILSSTVFAQQRLSVMANQNDDSTYLAYTYECDHTKWFSLPTGQVGFKLNVDKPPFKLLAISLAQYDMLRKQGMNESWKIVNANKEITRGFEKVKQFEEAGNIEAMRHWQIKTGDLANRVQLDFVNDYVREAGERIIKEKGLEPYYAPYLFSPQKYKTFAEMIEVHDKNCMYK